MEKKPIAEITAKIAQIKQNFGQAGQIFSNYHYQFTGSGEMKFDSLENERAIAFGYWDGDVYRVYFFAAGEKELSPILSQYPAGSVIELLGKGSPLEETAAKTLEKAGFVRYSRFERYHIKQLKERMYENIPPELRHLSGEQYGRWAEPEDAEAIYQILTDTFDKKESHLCSIEELKEQIRGRRVRVADEKGRISTIVTFLSRGRKLYVEHAVNFGKREKLHCVYLFCLELAISGGINYAYTWVEEKNERSHRLIHRFGYEKDGLSNDIFVKGKGNENNNGNFK